MNKSAHLSYPVSTCDYTMRTISNYPEYGVMRFRNKKIKDHKKKRRKK